MSITYKRDESGINITPRLDATWSPQEGWRMNHAPTIERTLITGPEQVGSMLTAYPEWYSDYEGDVAGVHFYQWYRADNISGDGVVAISLATNPTYVLEAADLGKWVCCSIIPSAATGTTPGIAVFSSLKGSVAGVITGNEAPSFTSVTLEGEETLGSALTATANGYYDAEADAEGVHTYAWWRADDAIGTGEVIITGETATSYVLTTSDLGKFISCKATPVAVTGSSPGNQVQSSRTGAIAGSIVGPAPENFVSDQVMNIGDDFVDTDTVGYVTLNRNSADGTEAFVATGGDTTAFSVDSSTGEVTVIDDTQLDNSTDPIMTLDVNVSLSDYTTKSITVTINVYAAANTFYVDSSVGASGDGTTPATAWQLNSDITGISAGDLVMFRRGLDYFIDTRVYWTTSGTAADHIVFSDYDSGTRPKWTVVAEHSLAWTDQGGNVWRNTTQAYQVNRLKIDGSEVLGTLDWSELGTNIGDVVTFFWGDNGDTNDYFYIYSADSPALHTLEYSDAYGGEDKVVWNYADYVDYENIEIEGGTSSGLQIRNSSYVTVTNCKIGAMCGGNGLYLYHDGGATDNILVDNCILDADYTLDYSGTVQNDSDYELRGGADGIRFYGCQNSITRNCYIKNWGHGSISLAGASGEITGNEIYNNTMTAPDIAYGGRFSAEEGSHGNEIYNNLIEDTSVQCQLSGYENHFHHNIVKDVSASSLKTYASGAGIHLQGEGTYNYDNIIENNLFINTENPGISIGSNNYSCDVTGNIIRNNITYNCGTGSSNIGLTIPTDTSTYSNDGNIFQNNLIYSYVTTDTVSYYGSVMNVTVFNAQTTHSHTISSNIASDPLFILDTSDYHLNSNSPCIDAGITPLSTEDYEGNTIPYSTTDPDIGLYEYQDGAVPPPSFVRQNDFLYDMNFIIDDNLASGDYVGTVKLLLDKADGSETLALSGTDASDFDIDTDGVLTVSSTATLSGPDTLTFTVTGTLDDYADDTCTITVQVYTIQNEYYVDGTLGNDGNAGTSEGAGNAWATIDHAASTATAGDKVWILAGNYGAEEVVFDNIGTSTLPIVFEGYATKTATQGNIHGRTFQYGDSLSSSVMPLIDGGGGVATGLNSTSDKDYLVIKNIQITGYTSYGARMGGEHNYYENLIAIESYRNFSFAYTASNCVIRECTTINGSHTNFDMSGDYTTVDYIESYGDTGAAGDGTDYYCSVYGNYNTIINGYLERAEDTSHGGHGFSIQCGTFPATSENNTVRNCRAVNFEGEGFQVRWRGVGYNTIQDCVAEEGISGHNWGYIIRDGAHHNTFRRCQSIGGQNSVAFFDTSEDGGAQNAGHDNTFEYCIFRGSVDASISFHPYDQVSSAYDNLFNNCIFDNGDELFYSGRTNTGTILTNCIIVDHNSLSAGGYTLNVTYADCCFYDNGFAAPSGSGILTTDPLFTSLAGHDYRLKDGSDCINAGANLSLTEDFYYNPVDSSPNIGVHEGQESIIPVTGITISSAGGASTIITDGGTLQMSVVVLPVNATTKTVTWSITNGTGTATINQSGLVTAATDGTVTVRATANDGSGIYDTFGLIISGQITKILFDGTTDYVQFDSVIINNLASWGIGFRIDQFASHGSPGFYDYICGSIGLDGKICLSDNTSYHVGFFDTTNTAFFWDGTGNTTTVTAASLASTEHSLFFRADGTNIHLYVDGVDMGYVTPTTTNFTFRKHMNGYYNTTQCVNAVSWDLRTWNSDVGDAQALLYDGDTIDSDEDHKYGLEQLVTNTTVSDETGSIDGLLYGNPTNV